MKESLRQQLAAFESDENALGECSTFFDWFCKEKSLPGKAKGLFRKVKWFAKIMNVDLDKTYVIFKNNCPCYGRLYDDFRICDIESGDVIYTVAPSLGYTNRQGEAEVYGIENDFDGPLFKGESWSVLKRNLAEAKKQVKV